MIQHIVLHTHISMYTDTVPAPDSPQSVSSLEIAGSVRNVP